MSGPNVTRRYIGERILAALLNDPEAANGEPVDLYQQLYSLPEPEKNRWQRIIGIFCMVLSGLIVGYLCWQFARSVLS